MGEESKIYTATTRRKFLIWLLIYWLFMLSTDRGKTWLTFIIVVIIVVIILAMFIKYSFAIEEHKIIYKIFLFNHLIYQKQVDHSMIKKVVF